MKQVRPCFVSQFLLSTKEIELWMMSNKVKNRQTPNHRTTITMTIQIRQSVVHDPDSAIKFQTLNRQLAGSVHLCMDAGIGTNVTLILHVLAASTHALTSTHKHKNKRSTRANKHHAHDYTHSPRSVSARHF